MRIEEIHIYGVYMPAALFWAVIAMIATVFLRRVLARLPLGSILWQPALVELLIFMLLWLGIASLADAFLPRGFIS